ncbi:MAG: UDP-N-acetylglucosamine 1-carboxyvinyltransferase [Lachnospiraceae bacterium]|nr:UDP-N-acetylglucosamine 1-carboxyvinyltransferase [Lachnospiraceae bacterium]
MRRYAVKGGAPLVGEVEIGGAKNAALGILAAALMSDETVEIENVPDLSDIDVMLEALRTLGAKVDKVNRHTVRINGSTVYTTTLLDETLNKIRGSYYFVGALLGKYGNAEVILPGGCSIGSRPVDLHMKGFRALGATAEIDHACMVCNSEKLVGSHIFMDGVSVGATINIMLAAVMAEGQTYIENAAKEPHVVDVANFLNSMGASIKGAGTDVIRIKGVEKLHATHYSIIPDQIEAGTFMMAAAATKGDVLIKNVIPKHLESITSKLLEIGCEIEEFDDSIRVVSSKPFFHTQVKTAPYPGFPTDMQPQMAVVLGLADGISVVTETIFENRLKYIDELVKLGGAMRVEGNTAIIEGIQRYSGGIVTAPDLRAGAALVVAGLCADGITVVNDIQYVERGYEDFPEKLRALGGQVEVVETDKELQNFRLRVG